AVSAELPEERALTPASRFRLFFIALAILVVSFARPLYEVMRLAFQEEIHSHIFLIPLISLYLLNLRRATLPAPRRGSIAVALVTAAIPVALLALPSIFPSLGVGEQLSLRILAFWSLL